LPSLLCHESDPMTSPGHVQVGKTYRDADGRELRVTEYDPTAPGGRNVVGELTFADGTVLQGTYATDLTIFKVVWLDRKPWTPEIEGKRPGRR
jgi:hypothetical protein